MDDKIKERTPWQRLALSLVGISVIIGIWQWAVWHVYSIPIEGLATFDSITTTAFYTISAIVIFMISGKLIYDFKHSTASTVMNAAQSIKEEIKQELDENRNITEKIEQVITYKNTKEEDYTLEEPK